MNIFISYSHKDRVLVGEIKTYFTFSFGFNVILAHEDIEPTQAWEDEILSNLRSCNVFIPIITEHYYNSVWTDQETGFVLGKMF